MNPPFPDVAHLRQALRQDQRVIRKLLDFVEKISNTTECEEIEHEAETLLENHRHFYQTKERQPGLFS